MFELARGLIKADIGDVAIGDFCKVDRRDGEPVDAEVMGFEDGRAILLPYGDLSGIRRSAKMVPAGRGLSLRCGRDLRGVVVDGLGRPYPSSRARFEELAVDEIPLRCPAPDPEARPPVEAALPTGTRAIDGCLTIGEGQRIGLYAGLGVGQATLMGRIACFSAADVVVIHIDGHSTREVLDFQRSELAEEGMARALIVATQMTDPPAVRMSGLLVAHRLAEHLCEQGLKVLLLVNDLRSVADAQHEVGKLLGEPDAPDGLAPSVYRSFTDLFERAGRTGRGSVTAIYGIKVYGAEAANDRLTGFTRRSLDGHIVMNRQLAARNHWPAIDVAVSLSRMMNAVVPAGHKQLARKLREVLETQDPERVEAVNGFLRQGLHEKSTLEQTVAAMVQILG